MHWRFKFYKPENAESQPQAWYDRQIKAVRAGFSGQLFQLALKKDGPESQIVPGYREVQEIAIEIDLPDGVMKVSVIGVWQKDSPNFIILLCCEESEGDYDPPLYQALELRKAWDSNKGRAYEHIPVDEPDD